MLCSSTSELAEVANMDADKHRVCLRNNRGLTARQLDRRSEQARHLNDGEEKLLKTTLGKLDSKEKKSVKLLRRTTEDLKKTLHELNMAGKSVKIWMELEGRAAANSRQNAANGGCQRKFTSTDENGGNANDTSLSEYSRYRLPRIGSAIAGPRKNGLVNGAGPRRYSENDLALASQLLQLKLKSGDSSVAERGYSETETESASNIDVMDSGKWMAQSPHVGKRGLAEKSQSFRNLPSSPGPHSPQICGDKFPGKHAWIGNVYKTDSPRDSPYESPRDSPRNSPKLLHRSSENLHRSVSSESLGLMSLSNASLSDISLDVTTLPPSPDEQRKSRTPFPCPPNSSFNSQLADDPNSRNADRPDTPAYQPRPPLSPRIPIPNIKITQSRMQPVLELADIDPLVPTSPLGLASSPGWPVASAPTSEWRAEKPLRDARRKMLLNLPATFAALSRRRHSSPENQDEAVKICRERFSEMLEKRRASEQSELQAKVKEFLNKTMSSSSMSSSSSSSEPAIDGLRMGQEKE